VLRYGDEIAYAPHSIQLTDPSVVNYISNGRNPLDFQLLVTDLAGQNVTAGQTLCHCLIDGLHSERQDWP